MSKENKTLTVAEVVGLISEATGLTKQNVKEVFKALKKLIEEGLEGKYEKAGLPELGNIVVVEKKKRSAINPKTKEKIEVPPKRVVKIKLRKSISVKEL